jgi:hypothetical protein
MASDGFVAVLFGGDRLATSDGSSQIVNDTWAWYDQTWRQIQDIGAPPRAGHAMANVPSDDRDHITLYGGQGRTRSAIPGDWKIVRDCA